MSEQDIEQQIQDKGLNEPRLTPDDISKVIESEEFYIFPNTAVTVCLLHLVNGSKTVGYSACVSPGNFDTEIGQNIARENARKGIWELEGYLLKQRLYDDAEGTTKVTTKVKIKVKL